MPPEIKTLVADWTNSHHREAVVELIDVYSRDAMGQGRPLDPDVRQRLGAELARRDHCLAVLALIDEQPAGVAVCFEGFSTFLARPLINIHDLGVHPDFRGCGVGRALLEAVEQVARKRGCGKITLEVRTDNHLARTLYLKTGYGQGDEKMLFWTKPLE